MVTQGRRLVNRNDGRVWSKIELGGMNAAMAFRFKPEDVKLLAEIRDLLKTQATKGRRP